MGMPRPSNCKLCGRQVFWRLSRVTQRFYQFNMDGSKHCCKGYQIKIYTQEEIAQLNAERGTTTNDRHTHPPRT